MSSATRSSDSVATRMTSSTQSRYCRRATTPRSGVSGRVRELCAAGGEKLAFGVVACQQESFVVGKAGLVIAVEAAEVFSPGGGQVVVAGQLRFGPERIEGCQAG